MASSISFPVTVHSTLRSSLTIATKVYVTGFVKIDPNHTGTEIYFIAEH